MSGHVDPLLSELQSVLITTSIGTLFNESRKRHISHRSWRPRIHLLRRSADGSSISILDGLSRSGVKSVFAQKAAARPEGTCRTHRVRGRSCQDRSPGSLRHRAFQTSCARRESRWLDFDRRRSGRVISVPFCLWFCGDVTWIPVAWQLGSMLRVWPRARHGGPVFGVLLHTGVFRTRQAGERFMCRRR